MYGKVACLVAVRETAHARHDAEHVVVHRVHTDLRAKTSRTNRVVGERKEERRVINTREVARAAGLVLLGLEGKRVDVDADRGDVGVVLVGLDQVEVASLTLREAVVTVELDLRRDDGVVSRHALNTRNRVARLQNRAVPPVRVVEGLLSLPGTDNRAVAADIRVALDDPDKLLRGVVEVELDLVRRRRNRLTARELELLDQVLVRDLGEAAALIRVEVDVVDIERRGDKTRRRDTAGDRLRRRAVPAEVGELLELEPDLDFVVLERDERERKTRVAAEPELERNVQRVLRRALADLAGATGFARAARVVAALTALDEEIDEFRNVANHLGVAGLLARLLRQLIPDLEPVTVVLIDLLSTNLNVDVVDKVVTDPVEPAELGTRAIRTREENLGKRGLEVDTVDKIAVTGDRALNLLAEVRRAVERLFNRLHGEVRVAAVHDLEERDLGIAREVNILCTIRDKLH